MCVDRINRMMFALFSYMHDCVRAMCWNVLVWMKIVHIFLWTMGFANTCALHFAAVTLFNYARMSTRMTFVYITSRLNVYNSADDAHFDICSAHERELTLSKKCLDDWCTASINRARVYMSYWSATNPIVVKVMQSFAGDFVHLGMDMDMFTKHVPITDYDVDRQAIDALRDAGVSFDTDALKISNMFAGMASIVIRGRYKDRDVAVKMLRTDILTRIETGIKEMKMLTDLVFPHFFSTAQVHHFDRIADTVYQDLVGQTTLTDELNNGRLLYELVKATGMEFAHIPQCFPEVTRAVPTALVMEWNHGCFIDHVEPSDALKYAENLIVFGAASVLFGLVHADMHTGNIQFMGDGHFAVCDFGIMHRSTPDFQRRLAGSIERLYPVIFPERCHKGKTYSIEEDAETIAELCLDVGIFENADKSVVLPPMCADALKREIINMYKDLRNTAVNTSDVHDMSGEIAMSILGAPHHLADILHSPSMSEYCVTLNDEFIHLQTCVAMARGIALLLFTSAMSFVSAPTDVDDSVSNHRGLCATEPESVSIGAQFHTFIADVFGTPETMATMMSATYAAESVREEMLGNDIACLETVNTCLETVNACSNERAPANVAIIDMIRQLRTINLHSMRRRTGRPQHPSVQERIDWRALTSVMDGNLDVENMKTIIRTEDISHLEKNILTAMCALSTNARLQVWLATQDLK